MGRKRIARTAVWVPALAAALWAGAPAVAVQVPAPPDGQPATAPDPLAPAAALAGQKKHAEAVAALRQLLGTELAAAQAERARVLLGDSLLELGRFAEALTAYDAVPKGSSARGAALFGAGRVHLALKAEDKALTVLTEAFAATEYQETLGPRVAWLLGEIQLRRKAYPEAIQAFYRVTRWPMHPNAPQAYFNVGDAHRLAGQAAEAAVAFRSTAERYPNLPVAAQAARAAGDLFLSLKKLPEAEAMYRQVLQGHPDSADAPHAQLGLGRVALAQENYPIARAAFQAASLIYGKSGVGTEAELRIADTYLAEGNADEARKRYAALAASPSHAVALEAQYGLGQAHLKAGRTAPAAEAFRKLLSEKDDGRWSLLARLRLAEERSAAGDYAALPGLLSPLLTPKAEPEVREPAVALLRGVVEKHAGSKGAVEAAQALAAHYRSGGQETLARELEARFGTKAAEAKAVDTQVAVLERALRDGQYAEVRSAGLRLLETKPEKDVRLKARAALAEAAVALKHPTEAEEQLREILREAAPTGFVAGVHARMAAAYQRTGQQDQALSLYRSALTAGLSPEQKPAVLLAAAGLLADRNRPGDAEPMLREVVERHPKSAQAPEALYALAWAQLDQGKRDSATPLFSRLVTEFPRHPLAADAGFRLGEAEFAAGRYQAAAERYRVAAQSSGPAAEPAAYRLGWALRKQGDHPGAAAAFLQVVTQFPQSSLAAESRVRAGEAYLELEQDAKALELFRAVLQSESGSRAERSLAVQARVGAALALLMEGKTEAARQMAESAALPGNGWYGARAQLVRAEATYLKSGPKEALPEYLRTQALYGRHRDVAAEALFRAGECHEKLGNRKEALALWDQVAATYSDSPWAARARSRAKAAPAGTTGRTRG